MAFRKILIIGYGSIGQALTPLLLRHFGIAAEQLRVIAADDDGRVVAAEYGIAYENLPLTPGNYASVLDARVGEGDLILNLSVQVSSVALIEWARDNGVHYLDTCIEPWAGGYEECGQASSNYALRHAALSLWRPRAPTAIVAHGANPGLITHFVKEGLVKLADRCGVEVGVGESYGDIAKALSIRVVQIAERDTQKAGALPADLFANTWSADGLLAEAWQFGEFGWGTHERILPAGAEHFGFGDQTSILVPRHSASIDVKSWVPHVGEQLALAITHHEAHSIAAMLTVPASEEGEGRASYRPTVYYAYRPCDATFDALDQWRETGFKTPARKKILTADDLTEGLDQLGALFVFPGGAFWYGSTLTLAEARATAPHNTATSLQVVAGILGAIEWMHRNPSSGVVEAETMDHEVVLRVARPYLGTVTGALTDWQPAEAGELEFQHFDARHVPQREEEAL